jgi:hypothetical protein
MLPGRCASYNIPAGAFIGAIAARGKASRRLTRNVTWYTGVRLQHSTSSPSRDLFWMVVRSVESQFGKPYSSVSFVMAISYADASGT